MKMSLETERKKNGERKKEKRGFDEKNVAEVKRDQIRDKRFRL